MVQLKVSVNGYDNTTSTDFNTYMVQLKVDGKTSYTHIAYAFQYLYGAIKSAYPTSYRGLGNGISIPIWCS
ncbi:hypothetical protein [Myroides odoratimimus]